MTYRIAFTPRASRDLHESLPEPVAAAAIEFIFGALAENPHRVGKALHYELAGQWSARRGQYRITYIIHDDIVLVTILRIAHRRDAYR